MVVQMAREGMAVRQSLSALEHGLGARMDRIEKVLRRPGQTAADERYAVGMRYIQGLRLDDGHKEPDLVLQEFGGHHPSLLPLGWLALLDSNLDRAQDWLEKALCHAGQRIKEHFATLGSKACLYWHGLALELAVHRPAHAVDALWCDPKCRGRYPWDIRGLRPILLKGEMASCAT